MKKLLISAFLIILTFSLIGCKSEEEEPEVSTSTTTVDPRTTVVANSLIDIPSSISSASSSSSSRFNLSSPHKSALASTGDDDVEDFYDGIRDNIGSLEAWATGIRAFTTILYTISGASASGDWTDDSPGDGEASRIVWGPDTTNGYDTLFEFYYDGAKGFEAYLTVNQTAETAKGVYTWDFSVAPNDDDPSSDAKVQFAFDSTDPTNKTMSVKVQGMGGSVTSAPSNAWLAASQDDNNVISLWGNYYFPDMGWFSDASSDARNYVFAVTGYDETGQSDTLKNMAIMQLAIPEADTTTDTFWTTDSVSAIYIDLIKEIWADQNLLVQIAVLAIEDTVSTDGDATTIAELTDADVVGILEWARDNTGDSNADEIA